MSSDLTGLVRLSVGWLEKLQNRERFGALIVNVGPQEARGVTARRGPQKTRRGPKVQHGPNFKFNFGQGCSSQGSRKS